MTESAPHPDRPGDEVGDSTQMWTPDAEETRTITAADLQAARSSGANPDDPPRGGSSSEAAPAFGPYSGATPEVHAEAASGARPMIPDPSAASSHPSGGYGAPAYSSDATAIYTPVTAEQPYAPTTGAQTYAPPTGGQAYPPVGAPPYAPAAPPPVYGTPAVPVVLVPPPGAGPAPAGSRATAGLISAILGLVLAAAGCYLLFRFGYEVVVLRANASGTTSVLTVRLSLAGGGIVLLAAAAVLNAWSAWATVLPGVVLTGLGIWGYLSEGGAVRIDSWSRWLFKHQETLSWNTIGGTALIGLLLLAASLAAAIARSAGKRAASRV